MRRKAIAGIALLGIAAVAWLIWSRGRGHASSLSTQSSGAETAGGSGRISPRAKRPLVKPDPLGTLRLEGQVIDSKDSAPIGGATVMLMSEPPRTATTEADGSFAFDGLLARRYRLTAWKDAMYADLVVARVTATNEPITLRMKRGTTIDVAVAAGAGGAPIAGAHVLVDDERTIDTDARGIAEVRGLGVYSHYIEVTADGWAPARKLEAIEETDETRTFSIALSRGAALAGTVVDPGGHPVADADVWVNRNPFHSSVTTDAAGAWRFPALAAGHYKLGAESELLAPSDDSSIDLDGVRERTGVVLHLTRGTDALGTVVDDKGAPVAYARVHLQGPPDWNTSANADAQGHFALRGMPPRAFRLYATSDTRASPLVPFDGTKGVGDLRLVLADATITGTVVDEHGGPIAEAEVDAQQSSGIVAFVNGDIDVSDSRGRFTIGPLPDASYSIGAHWPGMGHDEETFMHHEAVTAKPGQHDVRVVLPATGTITGVVTMDGKPLAHYAVAIDARDGFGFSGGTIIRGIDGRFTRHKVPPDTWKLAIVGDDTELHEIDGVEVEAGKTTDLGTIDLPLARRVHGRVVDSAGAPVAGADVLAGMEVVPFMLQIGGDPLRVALQGARHVTTDPDGRFDMALPGTMAAPTPQKVAAFGPGGARSAELAIPGDDVDVVMQLAPPSVIRGEVRGAGGGVDVQVRGAGFGATTTDDHGHFQFDGLAPGHYTLIAFRNSQETDPVEIDVSAGATATADLAFP